MYFQKIGGKKLCDIIILFQKTFVVVEKYEGEKYK